MKVGSVFLKQTDHFPDRKTEAQRAYRVCLRAARSWVRLDWQLVSRALLSGIGATVGWCMLACQQVLCLTAANCRSEMMVISLWP